MTTTFSCNKCSKSFATKSSLDQHRRDANHEGGRRKKSTATPDESHSHNPPHEGIQGYWIDRIRFRGDKSFGHFQCVGCSKPWSSAHAFRKYKQGCQTCESYSYPCCLWVNTGEDNRGQRQEDDEEKPHDSFRCEACRKGKCHDRGW